MRNEIEKLKLLGKESNTFLSHLEIARVINAEYIMQIKLILKNANIKRKETKRT